MRDMNTHQNVARPFWKQPESRRLEFKEIFPGGDQIAKTAIAFANGAGGKIILDNGYVPDGLSSESMILFCPELNLAVEKGYTQIVNRLR